MFTTQIERALSSDPIVEPHLLGVFASDQLPLGIDKYPSTLVANTDPATEKGEHWVCFYFDKNKNAEYFDSYGLPPSNHNLWQFFIENGRNHKINHTSLQGIGTRACGHYCIAYIAKRARGVPMERIIREFKTIDSYSRDDLVMSVVNANYKIGQTGGSESDNTCVGQCCCSRIKRRVC